jgi:uncharacterized protein YktA (UPF0223 family)
VSKDIRVFKGLLEHKAEQDQLDRQEHKGFKVRKVYKVIQDIKATLVHKAI